MAGVTIIWGDGPGAIIIIGGGDGPGAIIIMTGLADEAGEASMTLGLGFGEARPTPITAKLESSSSRGHASISLEYVETTTTGAGIKYVRMSHATKKPRRTLTTDSILFST